jgi:hypothetical protein
VRGHNLLSDLILENGFPSTGLTLRQRSPLAASLLCGLDVDFLPLPFII